MGFGAVGEDGDGEEEEVRLMLLLWVGGCNGMVGGEVKKFGCYDSR